MATAIANLIDATGEEQARPLEWLFVYSIESNGGIDDDWLQTSGFTKSEAEDLLRQHPRQVTEARKLLRLGRLFSLEMLFGLLRELATKMLAAATRPTEIRSLLGTLVGLEQRESGPGRRTGSRSASKNGSSGNSEASAGEELRSRLTDNELPRQQRRQLERMLGKLEKATR